MKKKISKIVKKNNKHPLEFLSRIEAYMENDNNALNKYGIVKKLVISFKRKQKKIPFLSRIAIKIISKQGGIIDTQFSDALKIKK